MWSDEDLEIRRLTYENLKKRGIGTPISICNLTLPAILPKKQQDEIRKIQKEHREYLSRTNPKLLKRKSSGSLPSGLGQKEAAFARALDARGFDTRHVARISRGIYTVSFGIGEWSLSKGDEILHTQPFGAGSINIVDRIISRNGGY